MTQPQAQFLDLYRVGLKSAADFLKASLENAERLQNQQLVALRSAIDQSSESATELGKATSLDQLMALQTRMVGENVERAMSYWGNLVQLATENQSKAIAQLQDQARWLGEATKR